MKYVFHKLSEVASSMRKFCFYWHHLPKYLARRPRTHIYPCASYWHPSWSPNNLKSSMQNTFPCCSYPCYVQINESMVCYCQTTTPIPAKIANYLCKNYSSKLIKDIEWKKGKLKFQNIGRKIMFLNSINKNWNIILRGFHPSSLIKVWLKDNKIRKMNCGLKKFDWNPINLGSKSLRISININKMTSRLWRKRIIGSYRLLRKPMGWSREGVYFISYLLSWD